MNRGERHGSDQRTQKTVLLVTDVQRRKGFDLVNLLRRSTDRYEILLASDASSTWLRWVYRQKVHRLRKSDPVAFMADLDAIVDHRVAVTYLPVEEDTTTLFYHYISARTSHPFRYLLPAEGAYLRAANKLELGRLCAELGIPAPRFFEPSLLRENQRTEPLPLVIKPQRGMGSRGVTFIDLVGPLSQSDEELEGCLIQERIGNPRAVEGAFLLCAGGEIVDFYSHERLRTFPPAGGVSVLSVTRNNRALLQSVAPLVRALNWSGLLMVEFILDPRDGHYKVIEVNPRLWGSVLLCEFSGSELLHNYVRLANGESPQNVYAANPGRYLRWVFPYDLLAYVRSFGGLRDFWHFDRTTTCFLNFTYARWRTSLAFVGLIALHKAWHRFR